MERGEEKREKEEEVGKRRSILFLSLLSCLTLHFFMSLASL
jgi:hypothetical protein